MLVGGKRLFDRVSLVFQDSQQTVGTMTTSFLYWLLPSLQSPDWCCLQHTLTMLFCLAIFKVGRMLKLSLVSWYCFACIPTKMYEHFLLPPSVSCVLKRTECGSSMPLNPISHFKKQTHPEFCSNTVPNSKREQRQNRSKFHTFYFYSFLFSLLASRGQAWSFIIQISPWAVTLPSSALSWKGTDTAESYNVYGLARISKCWH